MRLDMLAYADETASEPTIVIGAGVQPSWLERKCEQRVFRHRSAQSTGLGMGGAPRTRIYSGYTLEGGVSKAIVGGQSQATAEL